MPAPAPAAIAAGNGLRYRRVEPGKQGAGRGLAFRRSPSASEGAWTTVTAESARLGDAPTGRCTTVPNHIGELLAIGDGYD
jgi:hypothetical protein